MEKKEKYIILFIIILSIGQIIAEENIIVKNYDSMKLTYRDTWYQNSTETVYIKLNNFYSNVSFYSNSKEINLYNSSIFENEIIARFLVKKPIGNNSIDIFLDGNKENSIDFEVKENTLDKIIENESKNKDYILWIIIVFLIAILIIAITLCIAFDKINKKFK
jgi:ribosomal protein L25 (general stress protein Ctc)